MDQPPKRELSEVLTKLITFGELSLSVVPGNGFKGRLTWPGQPEQFWLQSQTVEGVILKFADLLCL